MIDLRFSSSLQIMLSLAQAERMGITRVTSSDLATSLGTNPSFLRQMLVPLTQGGLISSTMGQHGGSRLNRPAEEISLRDILQAAISGKSIFKARCDYPTQCLVSWNFDSYFSRLAHDIDETVLQRLGQQTLAEALGEIDAIDQARPDPSKTCSDRAT
ncbi:Rrf2 family transcriptional regulator [Pseudomonas sp. MPFS]|uniref:RrF2 family transcriptional regulator n=1 Tax=Pseudomonas sp. MPFS TaxID=2795724 RepID=UPI001F12EDE9|nr:Rrf2 family transcriptional regulator [Pseudomonas sp. MPFS]UMZ14196.1 Rrf2 family transcriptional regulator [Pseudomonas sp. MPFS]